METKMIQSKANDLKIGAFQEFSSQDYPDFLSCLVFLSNCPVGCRYCYNQFLQDPAVHYYFWQEILDFLVGRIGKLDAVVFSGGEPLMQSETLLIAMKEAKSLGFKIGLHTSGFKSEEFKKLLPYLDWVGLDIKAPFNKYRNVCKVDGWQTEISLNVLIESGIDFECRTTVDPTLLVLEDIIDIAKMLRSKGVTKYALQPVEYDDSDFEFEESFYDIIDETFGRQVIRR